MAEVTVSSGPAALIDDAMPKWRWREYHQRLVKADPQTVWKASLAATMGDLVITRQLMTLRGLGQGMQRQQRDRKIFDALPPCQIAVLDGQELLLGLIFPTRRRLRDISQPDSVASLEAATAPGLIRLAMNLRLSPHPDGTLLSTETRAIANDPGARWRFAIYWTVIRPGSGLIRRDILSAIARRAEKA